MCCTSRLLDIGGYVLDASQLKEYILENDKIEYILESIGCENIKSYQTEYRCSSEEYTNPTSISVKKDTLKIDIYSSHKTLSGDIYTLIMDLCDLTFPQSVKKAHEILGLTYSPFKKNPQNNKKDILDIFKRVRGKNFFNTSKIDLELYEEDICSEYIKMPYIGWVREGIMPHTQDVFGIGYSVKNNRIIIPHRYWGGQEDTYVGIIGRTLNKNFDILGIPKYFPLVSYPKSMNLYGLQENHDGIQRAGYVVVFESEKSPMKRHSRGDYTGVAVCSHSLSDEQIKILISLNVEIVIAYDKDIPVQHILNECARFEGIRKVSYIYDEYGLLKPKESPADTPDKVYKVLLNRRKAYQKGDEKRWQESQKSI